MVKSVSVVGKKGVVNRVSRNIREYFNTGKMKHGETFSRDLAILEERLQRLNASLNGEGPVEFSPFVQKMFKLVGKNKLVESFNLE